MRFAGHFDDGAPLARTRTAQDHAILGKRERPGAMKSSGPEQHSAAKPIRQRQGGDRIEGGLDGGRVIAARGCHFPASGNHRQFYATAAVTRVREIHDAVATSGGLIVELPPGAHRDPRGAGWLLHSSDRQSGQRQEQQRDE